ncbi:MAG: ferredoxin [Octadecabacter sp.]|nr:ferredoxin [Octadecabacter sp.]
MTLNDIVKATAPFHLTPLGGFHEGDTTTILLGPMEPGFWAYVTQRFEFCGDEPLDNWSHAIISLISKITNSQALFPFGGPPYHSFISWALRSGETWQSPVGLLVHKDAGLLVSYRGALQFDYHIDLLTPSTNPCDTCADQPCLIACPVSALSSKGYDVPSCKAHIKTDAVCSLGCRVRMACPVSLSYGRIQPQTAFHMKAFMKE